MKWRKSQSECNNCFKQGQCPEENPEIKVYDYVAWMKGNCSQYPKERAKPIPTGLG